MAITDKKGINVTSGFKLVSPAPIDVRLIAEDENDLQSLINNRATYSGMIVWVESLSKFKFFNGKEFTDMNFGGGGGNGAFGYEEVASNLLGEFILGEGELA